MMKNLTVVFFASALIFTNINAQERNDVIKVYNEGAKSMQTDLPAAIQAFESVITISEQVGESADDLKQKAMQVLPGLYLKSANNVVKENKSVAEIVQAAKVAVAATDKYGTATHKETAKRLMVQAYNIMGTSYFTEKEYENALLAFDSLLIVDPDYSNAIYNKALVYRSQNNSEAFEEAIDLYLSKLAPGTDDERSKQASAMALEYFRAAGSQANQAENLDEALLLLNKAAKYGDDKDLFYFFADVYNKQSKFDSGVEYAQKGLEMETDDAEAKAKFYFQLGLAQAGKGQTAEACASFKNSLYGPFAEPSKAQRTNLKCQ
ncbi:MAG: tetratricopeptide repeat protein [Bacteroidales bacterium]